MKIGKLAALMVIASLGWQQKEIIEPHLRTVRSIGPVVRTYMDMRMYRTGLMAYRHRNDGATPPDLTRWLEQQYDRGVRPASQDLFGQPFRVERGETRWSRVLRSCGPDTRCHTDDDLVISLDLES